MKNEISFKGALKHLATQAAAARRRDRADDDQLLEAQDPFLVDLYKILESKAFRRLGAKTQVQTGQVDAHIRCRSSRSMEVLAVAGSIADLLGLNVNLCLAIAAGHDIGHTPFGHAGETYISQALRGKQMDIFPEGKFDFRHELFAVVVSQYIERSGKGLNLTHQTLDGILRHSRGKGEALTDCSASEEANAVMFADKIGYILADYNDLFLRELLSTSDHQELASLMNECGHNQRLRTWYFVSALCQESAEVGRVSFSECEAAKRFERIKRLMYGVYNKANLFGAGNILAYIHSFLISVAGDEFNPLLALALMTDQDILHIRNQTCLSRAALKQTSVWALIPILQKQKDLSLTDPKLDW